MKNLYKISVYVLCLSLFGIIMGCADGNEWDEFVYKPQANTTNSDGNNTGGDNGNSDEGITVKKDIVNGDYVYILNNVTFTMKSVAGGTFSMGSNDSEAYSDEKPVHRVTLSNFMIGETEVTQELWEIVMGENPSNFKGAKKPVERVSWDDCQKFIKKLNSLTDEQFRLPTEAEWEFAARGGNKSKGYKYPGSSTVGNVAWYYDNSGSTTHDVKTKTANELGLYDMSGNVGEWCNDWYGSYSSGSQNNPQGATSGSYRVIRNGCWGDDAWYCRVSFRSYTTPSDCLNILGLRLAL